MPAAPVRPPEAAQVLPERTKSQQTLPRRTYRFRVLGMGLAGLPLIAVMHEIHAHWLVWTWMVCTCLLWPHVAYALARRSRDPFLAELRNFVVDSILAGSWVPLIHFNALPSVLLLTVATADKVTTGIRRLWLRSLPGMLIALLVTGVLTGFAFQPQTSMTVLLACLPIMVIHTLAVSMSSYRLVRKVQIQNQKLEELSRTDALTGLDSRGHWEEQAGRVLERQRTGNGTASVMLLDIDRFKEINDQFGHAAGDDVLRRIAQIIRRELPDGSHGGRLGGDEFAVVLAAPAQTAHVIAERVRGAVEHLDFPPATDLRCSISIGIAEPPDEGGLREWIEVADRALYRAKHAGRNRTMG